MNELVAKLLGLIDEFDSFGSLSRDLPVFAIAIGTLRKDRDIAEDIFTVIEKGNSGIGALALSRILTEDYFYLRYLESNPESVEENLDLFNTHPHIDHYASMQAMTTWGYPFSDEEVAITPDIKAGFDAHKDKFLRPGKKHKPYQADNYYRTWTKMNLDAVISKSHFDTDDQSSIHFLNENYNTASTVIHHNAFNIWYLATQDRRTQLTDEGYNDIASKVTFIVMSRLINLVINIYGKDMSNEESALSYLLNLEKIMDKYILLNKK